MTKLNSLSLNLKNNGLEIEEAEIIAEGIENLSLLTQLVLNL